MSVLGKRPLDYPSQPRPHPVPSVSTSHPTSPEMSSMDGYLGGDQYRAQIACLMDNRAFLENAINQRPPSPQGDNHLIDEYVVCTIRLDDLMRRLRRVESQDSFTTSAESIPMDTRAVAIFPGPLRFPLGPSAPSIPMAVAAGGGYYGAHGSR